MASTQKRNDLLPLLGVNIDHIATLRQLRGTPYPGILEAARLAEAGGADQITVHLREDRRHIQDEDVKILKKNLKVPLNLEMACSAEITRFACKIKPEWACLVPEKRKELTTEGGLNIRKNFKAIQAAISKLKKAGIRVSCFIEPEPDAIELSLKAGADAVELHTGKYCLATQGGLGAKSKSAITRELTRIKKACEAGYQLGIQTHAGHGLDYENVRPLAEWERSDGQPWIREYNIGHVIICRAAMVGLERAVREMASAIRAP